jgi:hypothetical protein
MVRMSGTWDSLFAAATDERARAARKATATMIASTLEQLAATANTGAFIFRSEQLRAMSIVVQIASELAAASVSLLGAGKGYAAATLIRQLVEAEYLVALFATDAKEAERWSMSSPAEIRKMFAPKSLRVSGSFADAEYWAHCDLGGHPNPKATLLLSGHQIRFGDVEFPRLDLQWADLCHHLVRLWPHVVDAFREYKEWVAPSADDVDERITQWREVERLTRDIVAAAMAM